MESSASGKRRIAGTVKPVSYFPNVAKILLPGVFGRGSLSNHTWAAEPGIYQLWVLMRGSVRLISRRDGCRLAATASKNSANALIKNRDVTKSSWVGGIC